MEIFTSATKIVLILMAIAVVVLTFMRIVDPKDFVALVVMVFMSYYKTPNPSGTDKE